MNLLRSLVFTTLLFFTVLPYSVAVLLCAPLPHRRRFAVAVHWASLNLWLARRLCGLGYVVEGGENLPEGPCVAYWKHSSVYETVAEFEIIPPHCWVLKHELMWIPFLGWALKLLRPIAIDRKAGGSAVRQVMRQGRERLAEGLWVTIFPEGTRMPAGQTRRYGLSGAVLARDAGVPIVPIAHNAGDYWPRRALTKRPGTVRFVIGPPISTAGRSPEEVNREAQDWIEGVMAQISPAYGRIDAGPAA